jgi:hypothetical protein
MLNITEKLYFTHNTASWVAQSVQCLTTDWTTGFDPSRGKGFFSSSLCVQTSCEAHPASYPTGKGVLSPGVKRGRDVTLTTHPHLEPKFISLLQRLHGGSGTTLLVTFTQDTILFTKAVAEICNELRRQTQRSDCNKGFTFVLEGVCAELDTMTRVPLQLISTHIPVRIFTCVDGEL